MRPLTLAVPLLASLAVACSSAAPGGPEENVGTTSAAISTATILSRADEWVTAKLLYCQAANHEADEDPSCPSTCTRTDNTEWDPYRSDCSGFVSWAWGLAAPGRTTSEFAPADTTVSFAIDGADLQPGDALNIPGDHIILFTSWQTVGSVANFYEEPGCSATPNYAHAFSSSVTITGQSVYVDYEGKSFTAIRYTGITTGDGGTVTSADSGTSATSCFSDTLGRSVVMNTCVQSASDGNWYQCDDASWVDRATDPAACVAVYPLGDAGADSGAEVADGGVDAHTASDVDASTGASSTSHASEATSSSHGSVATAAASTVPEHGSSGSGSGSGVAPVEGSSSDASPIDVSAASGCSVASRRDSDASGAWFLALSLAGIARLSRRPSRTPRRSHRACRA